MNESDRHPAQAVPVGGHTGQREEQLIAAFVDLADTLVDDYDVIDVLDRLAGHSVDLLSADAAGILLQDNQDRLRVAASTDERSSWMDVLQLETDQGPCMDCVRTGVAVGIPDLADAGLRWPAFGAALSGHGIHGSLHALPLRLRGRAIGALNLHHRRPGPLPHADLVLGQALADVATIGILAEQAVRRGAVVTEQLQSALHSRVIIEQAKGVLAQRGGLTMELAFDRLRRYSRRHNQRMSALAQEVVATDLIADDVLVVPSPTARSARRPR